jgi:hypothetical protein
MIEQSNRKYNKNHHYYDFLIALATEEGILTVRESIHLFDDLEDAAESERNSNLQALGQVTDTCEKWLLGNECEQYSIIAINGDLCWKEHMDLESWAWATNAKSTQ